VRLADWCASVVGKFDDAQLQQMLAAEHGDIADALANVYAMTGEPRHLALAKKFRHDLVFAPIAVGTDCLDMMHANTQIPKFRGYQRAHELTGETYWGNAASNFWRFVALERTYANGGKAKLSDRCVDNSFVAELLPQAARYLVRTVVFGNLFAHDEDIRIS
jgi:hypothetical protein